MSWCHDILGLSLVRKENDSIYGWIVHMWIETLAFHIYISEILCTKIRKHNACLHMVILTVGLQHLLIQINVLNCHDHPMYLDAFLDKNIHKILTTC